MAIFSKSKSEPLPEVELHLDHNPQKTFKSGDQVSGRVVIKSPISIIPEAVEVSLWGQSNTWIRRQTSRSSNSSSSSYRHYRDHAPLYNFTVNAFPSPYALLPDTRYEWPFQFQFPEGTVYNRHACYEDSMSAIWTSGPHLLPPTFVHGDEARPPSCSITYAVTTTLRVSSIPVEDAKALSCTAPLHFVPPSPPLASPPPVFSQSQKFSISSSQLTGIATPNLRQRFRDSWSKDTPRIDFELTCSVPTVVTIENAFDIFLALNVLNQTANVTNIPEVTFRITKLELQQFILTRAPRDWRASDSMSGYPSKWHTGEPRLTINKTEEMEVIETKTSLNAVPDRQTKAIPLIETEKKTMEARPCEAAFTGRISGFTAPSLQSFAINNSYRIKVKAVAEFCGEKSELGFEVPQVMVQSPPGI